VERPATVTVELPADAARWYADATHLPSHGEAVREACRKALGQDGDA
jgi:hypothetical protein